MNPDTPAPDVFTAVSSPVRRELLRLLRDRGPSPATALADAFDLSRPSVSEHLRVLRGAGLVTEVRQGRNRIYSLDGRPLRHLHEWLAPYERYWRDRVTQLASLLDAEAAAEPTAGPATVVESGTDPRPDAGTGGLPTGSRTTEPTEVPHD